MTISTWKMPVTGAGFCIFPMLVEWFAVDLAMINLKFRSWMLG